MDSIGKVFVLLFSIAFLSCSMVKGDSLFDNWSTGHKNSPSCATKYEIRELLKDHLANVKMELNETKHALRKDMEAMLESKKEEKSSKIIPEKNQCADAMYFKEPSITRYAKSVGQMGTHDSYDAITVCFWINTTVNVGEPTVLSYAVPIDENEVLIYLTPDIVVGIKPGLGPSYWAQRTNVWVSDGRWHHVCAAWKNTGGVLRVYKDGGLSYSRTGFKSGRPLVVNGTWIIGQDQDVELGGGFEIVDAFKGALTEVNVWNRVLNRYEISALANQCGSSALKGNLKVFSDFEIYGDVQKFKPSCCN